MLEGILAVMVSCFFKVQFRDRLLIAFSMEKRTKMTSKIALLRDDWDFDPRKMASRRGFGFGKIMKIR